MPNLKLSYEKRALQAGETPQLLCSRLLNHQAFLLESGTNGRYSYIGYDPFALVWGKDGQAQLSIWRDFFDWKKVNGEKLHDGSSYEGLRYFADHFRFNGKSPVPFSGGLAGFFSYDFGTSFVGVQQKVYDDYDLPDFAFFFVDKVLAFDHQENELYFLAFAPTDMEAERKVEAMQAEIQREQPQLVHSGELGDITSNISFDQYAKKIEEVKQLLRDGETYQVNFSYRFSADCTLNPWQMYADLQKVNPSPYSCYFDFGDYQLVSCSPELLVSRRGSSVMTKPIKGTIACGKTTAENQKNIDQLLASQKDEAELSMIVDLERNDLGKVCAPGSVRVAAHRAIEQYSHVIHTVSTVEGKLIQGKDFFDLFEAMFPGGSITGCPKKRTIEIVDRLEDYKRGVYTGSAGFIGFDGNADMNILIRTMLLKNGHLYFQAGGGIVIDSETQAEYDETLQKVASMRQILKKS